ncbi:MULTISPECIES: NAD/NADP octopine/nopaline dehydrogenase family protein [Pseudomonas]|uniref:NAD/NADP octopine/nopaline dehydrogenase family protein n=1 Tax=Pseudomonas TaxID=286 RepID=UPI001E50E073|nr:MULTISPECIES: NAD/NADP octopine/nopaline dehydrogenase family protein [Pseudomonas]
MQSYKVGIIGAGGIGLAYAAWTANRGNGVTIWNGRSSDQPSLGRLKLHATGVFEGSVDVDRGNNAEDTVSAADVVIICLPVNAHRQAIDAALPSLRSGQTVIVSSMGSLSALYLRERARNLGVDLVVASFGTTALTARRVSEDKVNIMVRRPSLGVSCLPASKVEDAQRVCSDLFGSDFVVDENPLMSTLNNTNAVFHAPLAILNWTRIERKESWPQYHYMTSYVCKLIAQLDAERLNLASAFGWQLKTLGQKLKQSFGIQSEGLKEIAEELHQKRGGPPGPIEVDTRYISEDVPYGLEFTLALGRIANVPMPVTQSIVAMSALLLPDGLSNENDLVEGLKLESESMEGLLARVAAA